MSRDSESIYCEIRCVVIIIDFLNNFFWKWLGFYMAISKYGRQIKWIYTKFIPQNLMSWEDVIGHW